MTKPVAALILGVLVACAAKTGPVDPQAAVTAAENARLEPIVAKYKAGGVVTGYDVKGEQLTISADAEKWSEQDEVAENQLKADLLAKWVGIWQANHARRHAELRVKFQNYYGEEIATVQQRV